MRERRRAEVTNLNRCLRPLHRARERRATRLKEGDYDDYEFKVEPLVDRDHRSHERQPQEGASPMYNQDVAESDWNEDAESFISEIDSWLFQTLLRKVEAMPKSQ